MTRRLWPSSLIQALSFAAYLIYKHGFTPSAVIGFMRLIRPGEPRSSKANSCAQQVLCEQAW